MMAAKQRHQVNQQLSALTLETIQDMADGQAAATVNAALAAAIRDTEDRGDDEKKRKVTVEIEFEKIGSNVSATVKAKTTLPPYVTKPTIGTLVLNGRTTEMMFSPTSADNPDQQTIGGDVE